MKHLDQVRLMLTPEVKALGVTYAQRQGLSLSMAVERMIQEHNDYHLAGAATNGKPLRQVEETQ